MAIRMQSIIVVKMEIAIINLIMDQPPCSKVCTLYIVVCPASNAMSHLDVCFSIANEQFYERTICIRHCIFHICYSYTIVTLYRIDMQLVTTNIVYVM